MTRRAYDNSSREAQAEKTRRSILDAVGLVLEDGLAALTMPAVAQAAGVSLPTVYRYFPDKAALIEAAAVEVRSAIGISLEPSDSLEALLADIRQVFTNAFRNESDFRILGAASSVSLTPELRDQRRAFFEAALKNSLKGLRGKERRYAVDAAMVIFSTATAQAMARFGFVAEDAADRAAWMLETLMAGVEARRKRKKR